MAADSPRSSSPSTARQEVESTPDVDPSSEDSADDNSDLLASEDEIAPDAESLFTYDWVNDDGYSYTIEVARPTIVASTIVEDALPGKVEIEWEVDGLVGIATNTTAGRNAPGLSDEIVTAAFWPADSPICNLEPHAGGVAATGRIFNDSWCSFALAAEMPLSGPSEIPMGESIELFGGLSGAVPSLRFEVDEGDEDVIIQSLQNDVEWAFAAGHDPSVDQTCKIPDWVASGGKAIRLSTTPIGGVCDV